MKILCFMKSLRPLFVTRSVHEDFMLYEISAAVIRHDVTVFLRHELDNIKEEFFASVRLAWLIKA